MKKSASERYFSGGESSTLPENNLRDAARACKNICRLRKAVSNTPRRKNEGKKMSVFFENEFKNESENEIKNESENRCIMLPEEVKGKGYFA